MIRFYLCSICGNLIEKIVDGDNTPSCCGRQMRELLPASTDGSTEKHVPVFTTQLLLTEDSNNGICKIHVQVGQEAHPMEIHHHIDWILLETNRGVYRKDIASCDFPEAHFTIASSEKLVAIYAYCNLHGLWKHVVV